MCTAQDMVQVRCTATVSCHVLFVYGALRSVTEAESSRLPTLRGGPHAAARTILFLDLPVRSCRESPGLFVLSLSHSWGCNRQWVVNPPAQLPWIAQRLALLSPRTGRLHALLNASAASESTAAGSLKACLIKRRRCQRVDHRW